VEWKSPKVNDGVFSEVPEEIGGQLPHQCRECVPILLPLLPLNNGHYIIVLGRPLNLVKRPAGLERIVIIILPLRRESIKVEGLNRR